MADKLKCYNEECAKILEENGDVWQVRIVGGDGITSYVPCCSESCADEVRHKYMAIHKWRYSSVERQSFQLMTASQYEKNC